VLEQSFPHLKGGRLLPVLRSWIHGQDVHNFGLARALVGNTLFPWLLWFVVRARIAKLHKNWSSPLSTTGVAPSPSQHDDEMTFESQIWSFSTVCVHMMCRAAVTQARSCIGLYEFVTPSERGLSRWRPEGGLACLCPSLLSPLVPQLVYV